MEDNRKIKFIFRHKIIGKQPQPLPYSTSLIAPM